MRDEYKPDYWARAFRLVALPFFAKRQAPRSGVHLMMQDGSAASFGLHVAEPASLLKNNKPLDWAWSSNVRHSVVVDADKKLAFVRKWDAPDYLEEFPLASPHDAKKIVRAFEDATPLDRSQTVIERMLATFGIVRRAIEERGGTNMDVIVAFNAALLLAELWRDDVGSVPDIDLGTAYSKSSKEELAVSEISSQVHSYPIGELTRILLAPHQAGTPYVLDPGLLVRHASGVLYQEMHRRLVQAPAPQRQRRMFDDALPSGTEGTRLPAPSSVHHTPPWLARSLVEAALSHFEWPQDECVEILDPACGSGVFLIEAARELEKAEDRKISLNGMELSSEAGLMAGFCLQHAIQRPNSWDVRKGVDSITETDWHHPHIVLMNPPFKAWKDLNDDEKHAVRAAVGEGGRPDLYLAFIARAARALRPGGVLASVVPATFLTSKSAKPVRDLFRGDGEFRVRMIAQFRGFKTFDDAMVEAAAIIVSRSTADSKVRMVTAQKGKAEQVVRWLRSSGQRSIERSGFDIYSLPSGAMARDNWVPHRLKDIRFAEKLTKKTHTCVADFFTVRLGVRGVGARRFERVLVVTEDEFQRFAESDQQKTFFRPTADRIENGRIIPAEFVFYPYAENRRLLLETEDSLASALPEFYQQVLLPAKLALGNRRSINRRKGRIRNRNWWEPSEPVTTWLAEYAPRIVSQEFGRCGNFAFDTDGKYAVVGGNGWCRNDDMADGSEFGYLAILNSQTFDRLLVVFCPRLQGGQYRLEGRFVHPVPLPDPIAARDLHRFGRSMYCGEAVDAESLEFAVLLAYGVPEQDCQSIIDEEKSYIEKQFTKFAAGWRKETGHLSRVKRRVEHRSYQQIVAMGKLVISPILNDLQENGPDDWFWALSKITGENPIKSDMAGNMRKMTDAWLEWGRKTGYLKS